MYTMLACNVSITDHFMNRMKRV